MDNSEPPQESNQSAPLPPSALLKILTGGGVHSGLAGPRQDMGLAELLPFPFFALVGFKEKGIRPLAVEDLIVVMRAALIEKRLSRSTVALTGPEELYLSDAVRRVAHVIGKKIPMLPAPVWFHQLLASFWELTMKVPLAARAQVRILSEGVVTPALTCDSLPADLSPGLRFTEEQIRKGLPAPGPFTLRDLRCDHA